MIVYCPYIPNILLPVYDCIFQIYVYNPISRHVLLAMVDATELKALLTAQGDKVKAIKAEKKVQPRL